LAEIFPLQPADAELVLDLANEFYPPKFALTRDQVFRNLEAAKKARCNLCYGIDLTGEFIGYLLAWVENTRIDGVREPVVLVDDICIVPEARHLLFSLFSALRKGIDEGGWGNLHLESAARVEVEAMYNQHPKVIERLGFRLTQQARYFSKAVGEELTWMRYSPIQTRYQAGNDGIELSEELLDDDE